MRHIAVFGGSFDPVHMGHLKIVEAVQRQVKPDRFLLIPCGRPPHRNPLIASADHRLQMLRLACEELSYLEIDSREIDREGPSYSYLTLEAIHKEHPDAQLLFVIGWDSLVSFTSWYRWRDILRSACLLVIGRDGDQGDLPIEMDLQVENWSKTALKSGKAVRLDFDETPISSTQVRKLLRQGLPAESYLKPEVCQYIQEQNIYQGN